MGLLLTGTREHALLVLLIQEASELRHEDGGYLGRTAIQKLTYFVQVVGVPVRYRFEIHHYGPYCDEVSRDMDWLMADRAVVDRSTQPARYSNYAPGPAAAELLALHADLGPHQAVVRRTVRALRPLQPDRLELIATLDYAYRQLAASLAGPLASDLLHLPDKPAGVGARPAAPRVPAREAVLARFRAFKGAKFSAGEVDRTYDELVQAGLFGA